MRVGLEGIGIGFEDFEQQADRFQQGTKKQNKRKPSDRGQKTRF
jgi:hypothetical protein